MIKIWRKCKSGLWYHKKLRELKGFTLRLRRLCFSSRSTDRPRAERCREI